MGKVFRIRSLFNVFEILFLQIGSSLEVMLTYTYTFEERISSVLLSMNLV